MPEMGYKPVNKYLPPRPKRDGGKAAATKAPAESEPGNGSGGVEKLFAWADRMLSR